jgi:hypothetical protein
MTNTHVLHDIAKSAKLGRDEEAMKNYLGVTESLFQASVGKGVFFPRIKFPEGLQYSRDARVELKLPPSAIDFAKRLEHDGPKISILLGGSGTYRHYPAIRTWIKIIHALNSAFPNLRIYLTGVRRSPQGRTRTAGYTVSNTNNLLHKFRNMINCYDVGLWNQLAIMRQSDVFLSPHCGFAFLAPCVNVPWLAISGGDWPEYFFNHVPFYSVLPDNPKYPCMGDLSVSASRHHTGKIPDMNPRNLDKKIPEIVEAAKLLMDDSFTYEKALQRHRLNTQNANVRRDRIHQGPIF